MIDVTSLRIGIDIGGMFTDFVIFSSDSGNVETFKLHSMSCDAVEAVLERLERILSLRSVHRPKRILKAEVLDISSKFMIACS
jgi:N-methylhydantoinase A/oxoprolinase/acetone carboxylase beta subunit